MLRKFSAGGDGGMGTAARGCGEDESPDKGGGADLTSQYKKAARHVCGELRVCLTLREVRGSRCSYAEPLYLFLHASRDVFYSAHSCTLRQFLHFFLRGLLSFPCLFCPRLPTPFRSALSLPSAVPCPELMQLLSALQFDQLPT